MEGQGREPEAAVDADLSLLIERWPSLPEAIRRAVMALVQAAQ